MTRNLCLNHMHSQRPANGDAAVCVIITTRHTQRLMLQGGGGGLRICACYVCVHVCLFVRLSAVCINGVRDPCAGRQSRVEGQGRACLGFLADPNACSSNTRTGGRMGCPLPD